MDPDRIGDRAVVCRDRQLFEAELDGDILGLAVETGLCYGFNSTAAEIWRLSSSPIRVEDLIKNLTAEFDVSPEACAAETRNALCELLSEGLIRIEEPPVA